MKLLWTINHFTHPSQPWNQTAIFPWRICSLNRCWPVNPLLGSNTGTHPSPETDFRTQYLCHTQNSPNSQATGWDTAFKQQHLVSLLLPPTLHQEWSSANSPTTVARGNPEKILLLLDILHCLALFTYVKCGTKYLLNFPHKRPNSEHSWKQFIVSLCTLTWVLCHRGRSHKAEQELALLYHLSQCSLWTKSITHI